MTPPKCFLTNSPSPGCSRDACTDCALVIGMLADLGTHRPRDLDYDIPEHVLRAAQRIAAASLDTPVDRDKPGRLPGLARHQG